MEADWEFEMGRGAPVIDAEWAGYVALSADPALARTLPESEALPALVECLAALNSAASPVFTTKCDVWPHPNPASLDLLELDASPAASGHAHCCYLDLVPHKPWREPAQAEAFCRRFCDALADLPLVNCRVDLVIRTANLAASSMAITAYVTACGCTPAAAHITLAESVLALPAALGLSSAVTFASVPESGATLQ